MIVALTVGALMAGAVYLMLQRDFMRVVLGFVVLSHAINLLIFSAGGTIRRGEPIGADLDPNVSADPLPQAFVLTAIVIAFSITIYLLALTVTGRRDTEDDGAGSLDPDDPTDTAGYDGPGEEKLAAHLRREGLAKHPSSQPRREPLPEDPPAGAGER